MYLKRGREREIVISFDCKKSLKFKFCECESSCMRKTCLRVLKRYKNKVAGNEDQWKELKYITLLNLIKT